MIPKHLQPPTRRPLRLPEVPEVPRQLPEVKIHPPTVFVHPVWEYKHLVRKRPTQQPPEDADLNVSRRRGLGACGDVRRSRRAALLLQASGYVSLVSRGA